MLNITALRRAIHLLAVAGRPVVAVARKRAQGLLKSTRNAAPCVVMIRTLFVGRSP
jgi:hypothetical protein